MHYGNKQDLKKRKKMQELKKSTELTTAKEQENICNMSRTKACFIPPSVTMKNYVRV